MSVFVLNVLFLCLFDSGLLVFRVFLLVIRVLLEDLELEQETSGETFGRELERRRKTSGEGLRTGNL